MITFDPETALAIASSTNATPIVVTTAINHGLSGAGHKAFIKGHLVNTNANGQWSLVITGVNTFELHDPVSGANSVGNGVGGATGNVIPYTAGGMGVPEDGEDADASAGDPGASIESMMAVLLDRIAFLKNATVLSARLYTSNGTDVVPDGTLCTILIGYGGGGGGGSGAGGTNDTTHYSSPGGSGAGARSSTQVLFPPPKPRTSQAVVSGAGGTGGAASAGSGHDGGDGGDTTYGGTLGKFSGAGGGRAGNLNSSSTASHWVSGGFSVGPMPSSTDNTITLATGSPQPWMNLNDGAGGPGAPSTETPRTGRRSLQGFAAGTAGANGATSGGSPAGGGAPGGGGGPGGVGGNGGFGGDGAAAFTGTNNGGDGASAAANSGAGGGAGGAAGNIGAGATVSGAGGNGGSGKLIVIHLGAPQ